MDEQELNAVMQARLAKLEELKKLDIAPFAFQFERTALAGQILQHFEAYNEKDVSVAGRIMSIRQMGKAAFAHIMDASGRIQIYVRKDNVAEKEFNLLKLLDIGDHIGLQGQVFKTRTDEITILVSKIKLLSKNIRPLPIVKEAEKNGETITYDAFSDTEQRYRQRYVDLIVNSHVKQVFIKRSKIISEMRHFLDSKGYLEVETPILQPIYGGAAARPFTTHHNTLNMTLYLRIADELYLKRLIVGGYEGVYEISKDFRNEGIDRTHNPEFTMMELYVAYKDYKFMMALVEEMVTTIAEKTVGSTKINYQGQNLDLTPPWTRLSLFDALEQYTGKNLYGKNKSELLSIASDLYIDIVPDWNAGKILDEIFKEKVEPKLIQPTFICDYPVELSPLAKRHRKDPNLVERFEPFVAGREIGNAFSELNDPIDQRHRFEAQMRAFQEGDEEAHQPDDDYIRALEYGMPPTAGLGMGIDRLVMLFTNSASIRDVIFFPTMRPEK